MGQTKLEKAMEKAVEMGLPVHDGMSLEEVEAAIAAAEGSADGNGEELGQEAKQAQTNETLGDSEGDENEQEKTPELDWKVAAKVLKKAHESCGYSIDDYYKRREIDKIRKRFNNKERTSELYMAIFGLE